MITWNELAWKMLRPMRNILEMHVKAFSPDLAEAVIAQNGSQ
jgi:hypothetical protein